MKNSVTGKFTQKCKLVAQEINATVEKKQQVHSKTLRMCTKKMKKWGIADNFQIFFCTRSHLYNSTRWEQLANFTRDAADIKFPLCHLGQCNEEQQCAHYFVVDVF